MGCDIHMYVEHRPRHVALPKDEIRNYWQNFGGRFNPGRHYELFGHIAGVRGEGPAVVEPRGRLPRGLVGWAARCDDWLFVSEDATDDPECCSPEQAESWARMPGAEMQTDANGKISAVTHPDHHTHTWLTLDELKRAMSRCQDPLDDEYYAIVAAIECLEKRGEETRVVIWFDN